VTVIATEYTGSEPAACWDDVPRLVDLARTDAVVVSVARRFYPPFSRVSPGMRCQFSTALREIWEEQSANAAVEAGLIAARLVSEGRKPLFVGRTGDFVEEVSQAARSAGASLVCLLVGRKSRKSLDRHALADLLMKADAPVMLIPQQDAKRHRR
jgi:hypothetical protein